LQAASIWFKGASAQLQEGVLREQLDPQDKLRGDLDRLEAELVRAEAETVALVDLLVRKDGRERGAVRDALRTLAIAERDLKAEVRDFASAVRAHDANVCAIASARTRAARHCATPEALADELDRLIS
jgi:hypothetical protein